MAVEDLESALALFPVTKFAPPPRRGELIVRPQLLERMDGPLAAQHILITGSAGSGKSTLAAQWTAGAACAAWVSLAPEDDDPGQLWAATVLALRRVLPGFGEGALPALRSGADPRVALVRLVDELADLRTPVSLVFDDLHVITHRGCHEGLEWLLDHAPLTLRLAFCTRERPPWAIERLEARGTLGVLRADDLRFDLAETERFLNEGLGLAVQPNEVAALHARTDGWAAALYLAALGLRGGATVPELLDAFDAGDRRISRYFLTEALARANPDDVRFLEAGAVLGRFCAPLCDAVLGTDDSAERIAALERTNLFVIPLDQTGTWFRLHHLFGDLLLRRLSDREPEAAAELRARAAIWHREQGDLPAAIANLLAAERFEDAAELVAASYPIYLNASRLGNIVGRWLDALPDDLIERSPSLCLAEALIAGVRGDRETMERRLEGALALEHSGPLPDGSPSAAAVAAMARTILHFGDLPRAVEHAREAVALHGERSSYWPLVLYLLGTSLWRTDGPTDEALELLGRATALTEHTRVHMVTAVAAPATRGAALVERGELAAAQEAAVEATRRRDLLADSRLPQMIGGWYGTAWVHRAAGRLEQAAADAETAVALVRDLPPELDGGMFAPPAFIELGRVRIAQGRIEEARELLADARERLERAPDSGRLAQWLEEAEREAGAPPRRSAPVEEAELSARELAVLRMLAGPLSLREIGSELFVSHNTVKSHAKAIYRKLGAGSRDAAVKTARDEGLIP